MAVAPPSPRDDLKLLQQLVAGQAVAEQRFDELFRRVENTETTAGEARDAARELGTVLREQDAQGRIGELRNETREQVRGLRQDIVHVSTAAKEDSRALDLRLQKLERLRDTGFGMARGAKIAIEIAKVAVAAGGGALLLLKLLGG